MALTRLPAELLDQIIAHVVPDGFESVAVTCRKIHALCTPFIPRYNALRSRFHHFDYYDHPEDSSSTIATALDLIACIAVEPQIARYVRDADFKVDGLSFVRRRPCAASPEIHGGDAVVRLFADSPYLKEAGLAWQDYYAEIKEDFRAARYSQYAAAFLLTLLPNVENLSLPKRWKPRDATDKLIDTVVCKARQSHLPHARPNLAQVTRFGFSVSLGPRERCDLDWATPFLGLPRIRSFRGPSCVALVGGGRGSRTSDYRPGGCASTLETVDLVSCCVDEVAIANFLRHTPQLRTLRYSHTTKENAGLRDWNLCKFVTAVEREAGSHLEGLSVTIRELGGSIIPGRASLRGFRRLRKLELPLEIASCNIAVATACRSATTPTEPTVVADGSADRHDPNVDEAFIGDLVPASVSQLSLVSSGTDDHATALDVMFRDFAATRKSTLPALQLIILTCLATADDAYKRQVDRLRVESEKAGVVLDLRPWLSFTTIAWDEE